jgi:hypothetical protein
MTEKQPAEIIKLLREIAQTLESIHAEMPRS